MTCNICNGLGRTSREEYNEEIRTPCTCRHKEITIRMCWQRALEDGPFEGLKPIKIDEEQRTAQGDEIIRTDDVTAHRYIATRLMCIYYAGAQRKFGTNVPTTYAAIPGAYSRIVTDIEIRAAYFDGTKHLELAKFEKKGLEPSKLIILLGHAAKHKSNGDALFEVVNFASYQGHDVWLIYDPKKPYDEKHPSWSSDMAAWIADNKPRSVNLVQPDRDPDEVDLDDLMAQADELPDDLTV